MAHQAGDDTVQNDIDIHQYYMDILNCMPNIVYWVDLHCRLKGCNSNYVQLLGLKTKRDFSGTPHEQMSHFLPWPQARIDRFKLDDLEILFTGEAKYHVVEAPIHCNDGSVLYYTATRVPLFDKKKQVIGLVVILTDVTANKYTDYAQQRQPTSSIAVAEVTTYTPIVLLVEDNYIAQKVESALLRNLQCHVDVADSGSSALALFTPGKYDIIFMDIGLQDTSGYLVSKKIRQLEQNTEYHVPIIALTSYQADVVQYDCNQYLMEGVLTKPLSLEQAKQIIQCYVYHQHIAVAGLKSGN